MKQVVFSGDEQFLFTVLGNQTVKMWSLSGKCVRVYNGFAERILSFEMSGDRQFFAVGDEKSISYWKTQSLLFKTELKSEVKCVGLSADGRTAVGCAGKVMVLSSASGDTIKEILLHKMVSNVQFLEGQILQVTFVDKTAQKYDSEYKMVEEGVGESGIGDRIAFNNSILVRIEGNSIVAEDNRPLVEW